MLVVVLLGGCAASSPLWSECDPQAGEVWGNPDEVPGQGTCPDGYACPRTSGLRGRCLVAGVACVWVDDPAVFGFAQWTCEQDPAACSAWHPDAVYGPGGCAVPCTQHSDCEGGQGCRSGGWCGPL
jgi:hypothetical protein